jgi:hypothetical protein
LSSLNLASLQDVAKATRISQRDLMKMAGDGKITIREISGNFFVEMDSLKRLIDSTPIVQFDNGARL